MSASILDPSAILSTLPQLLPAESKALASPQDGIASLLHAALTILGFRLTAIDESSTSHNQIPSNVLPNGWNQGGPGHYTFKYRHDQSSLEFIIKLSKLGKRTLINAIALESDKVASLDIPTDDFTSPSFYPHSLDGPDVPPLVHGFISSNRVIDLVSQVKLKIIQKLIPGLQKLGYTEEAENTGASSSANPPTAESRTPQPRPEYPSFDPLRDDSRSRMPGYPRNPLEIGRSDLDPFPANPFAPPSVFPRGGGDGMFVGPDHPILGIGRDRRNFGPETGPWGGDGFLPPMGAPPGARFDPVGPAPPNRGGFGFPGRGNRQNPDNDEFMPPGMGDMFM